jgi:hypothetical protein
MVVDNMTYLSEVLCVLRTIRTQCDASPPVLPVFEVCHSQTVWAACLSSYFSTPTLLYRCINCCTERPVFGT